MLGGVYRCINVKKIYPIKYEQIVNENALRFGLHKALIYSVIKVESDFNADAESKVGAIGLMQIMPETADYVAKMLGVKEYNLKDEKTNITFGCFYISYLLRRFSDRNTALCAYNAGEWNVAYWLTKKEYSENGSSLKYVPFPETREYIKKINKTFSKYEKLYSNILDK